MRIAAIAKGLGVGGIETFLINLSTGLQSRGHTFDFVCTLYQGDWYEKYGPAFNNVYDHTCPAARSRNSQVKALGTFLADQNYDAVLVNLSLAGQAAVDFLPERTVAISIVHEYLKEDQHRRIELCRLDAFDALVGVSEGVCGTIHQLAPNAPPVVCIPHGIPLPSNVPTTSDSTEIIFVGRITEEKGVMLLPEILSLVLAKGVDAHLTVVGGGPMLPSLKQKSAEMNLGDKIEFTGSVTVAEAHDRVEQAGIFLFPSRWEGFGLVLLEAMSLGAVPVSTRLPGVTDAIVQDGETGFLFEPNDAQKAAESICALLQEPSLRKSMIERGYAVLRERFTLDRMVDDYEKLLTDLQHNKRPVQRQGRLGTEPLRKLDALPVAAVELIDRLRGR